MKKSYVVAGILTAILLVAVGVFVWPMFAALSVEGGLGAVIVMIIACFAVGGVLIFLLLYSARKGYDDGAKLAPPAPAEWPSRGSEESGINLDKGYPGTVLNLITHIVSFSDVLPAECIRPQFSLR